jgi:hypothetical protein
MSTILIDRLCGIVSAGEMSRAGLARAAGLHPNSLRKLGDIIEDARNGRPSSWSTPRTARTRATSSSRRSSPRPTQINFMAKHARGLICLSITAERARPAAPAADGRDNQSGHGTAFTVSIEAREGVTTGISAHDRAHTIAVAIDPTKGPDDIVSPGHVFPLVAKDGGVLVRAGHTEAAVDISRMAGLNPAGVICEIMKDDGSRWPGCRPGRLRPAARPEDRHHRRPDRLSRSRRPTASSCATMASARRSSPSLACTT